MACKRMARVEWTKLMGATNSNIIVRITPSQSRLANIIVKPAMKSCLAVSLSLSSTFFIIRVLSIEFLPSYLFHDCPNTNSFAPNSTYRSNLDALLSSLSSAATNSTDGFANATAGQSPADRVYGLFLCRSDLDTATCSYCVTKGKQEILQRCPNQRVSVIWYDACKLRYSSQSIFSIMEREPSLLLPNDDKFTDPESLAEVVKESIKDVAYKASRSGSGKKCADAEMIRSSWGLYTLAQCTPDLAEDDCSSCLLFLKSLVVVGRKGGKLLTPLDRLLCFFEHSRLLFFSFQPSDRNRTAGKKFKKKSKKNFFGFFFEFFFTFSVKPQASNQDWTAEIAQQPAVLKKYSRRSTHSELQREIRNVHHLQRHRRAGPTSSSSGYGTCRPTSSSRCDTWRYLQFIFSLPRNSQFC